MSKRKLAQELNKLSIGDIVKLIKPWNRVSQDLVDKLGSVSSIDWWRTGKHGAYIYRVVYDQGDWLEAEGDCFEVVLHL